MKLAFYLVLLTLTTLGISYVALSQPSKNINERIYFEHNEISILKDTINNVINRNKTPILYFKADWCGPCKKIAKSIETGNIDKYDKITLIILDERVCNNIFMFFELRHVPYFVHVDTSMNIINNNILNKTVSNRWKNPNKYLDTFLSDLYPERSDEELKQEQNQRNKNSDMDMFHHKLSSDTTLSFYSRNYKGIDFDSHLYDSGLKFVEIQNILDTLELGNIEGKKAFSIRLYANLLAPQDLNKVMDLLLRIQNIHSIYLIFNGSIPNQIFGLSALKNLYLGEVSGDGKINNFSRITELRNLQSIHVYSSKPLVGIDKINGYLLNLKEIVLWGTDILPSWIFKYPNLRYLSFNSSSRKNLDKLTDLKNLEYLGTNQFHKNIQYLNTLKVLSISDKSKSFFEIDSKLNLEVLVINSNDSLTYLPDAHYLPNLRALIIHDSPNLGSIPVNYSSLTKLDYVYVWKNEKLANALKTNLFNVKNFISN